MTMLPSPVMMGKIPLCNGQVALSPKRATAIPSMSVNGDPVMTRPLLLVRSPTTIHLRPTISSADCHHPTIGEGRQHDHEICPGSRRLGRGTRFLNRFRLSNSFNARPTDLSGPRLIQRKWPERNPDSDLGIQTWGPGKLSAPSTCTGSESDPVRRQQEQKVEHRPDFVDYRFPGCAALTRATAYRAGSPKPTSGDDSSPAQSSGNKPWRAYR